MLPAPISLDFVELEVLVPHGEYMLEDMAEVSLNCNLDF